MKKSSFKVDFYFICVLSQKINFIKIFHCNISFFLIKLLYELFKLNFRKEIKMELEKQQTINVNTIIKILYKNKFLIALTTLIIMILATVFVFTNKSYKSEIILYGNDRVLNEIGENSQYSINSFDFYSFLKKNSKTLKNVNLPEDKFFKEMTNRLNAQSETNDPVVKVKFSTNNKTEGENFAKEYPILAQNYLSGRKNNFLDTQIGLLEKQYNFLTKNIDIRTTKDSLTDTLVSRLGYYRLLRNDSTPVVKYVNSVTKPALSKKLVIAGSLFLGLFLGILIAFIKEFSTTLDWNDIKKNN